MKKGLAIFIALVLALGLCATAALAAGGHHGAGSAGTGCTGQGWNYVDADGDGSGWYYGRAYGVRPTLTLSPSLLVSVECDEEEEDAESRWHKYLEYMIRWVISHSDKSFVGCCPVGYAEWINSNREDA